MRCRNTGVAISSGEVLAFTDADCYPEPRWLDAGVNAIGDGKVVVGGHVEAFPQRPAAPNAAERFEMLFGFEQEKNATRGVSVTANIVCPRAALDEVGPFGTVSHSAHDYEWCHEAVRKGYKVVYVADAEVRTPARSSFRALATKVRRMSGANYVRGSHAGTLWSSRIWALRSCRPPLRRLYRVLTLPRIGSWWHRAAVCCILLALPLVYAIEWVRMEAGAGQAERR